MKMWELRNQESLNFTRNASDFRNFHLNSQINMYVYNNSFAIKNLYCIYQVDSEREFVRGIQLDSAEPGCFPSKHGGLLSL